MRPSKSGGPRAQNEQYRRNGRIRAREVLVIDSDGQKLGLLRIEEALDAARRQGLDLIEVAPNARPPVCKILDWGKFRYQQAKHDKESRKHASASKVKEVKFRPNIADHDFLFKLKNSEAFLDKGMKVKLTLMFRGREMQHINLGFGLMKKVCDGLNHIAIVEAPPKQVGRSITAMLSPLPANKRVRKYSDPDEAPVEDDDDDDDDDESDHDDDASADAPAGSGEAQQN